MADEKKVDFCPYIAGDPLACEMSYRLDEYYRQMKESHDRPRVMFVGKFGNCLCSPEHCQRYLEKLKELQEKQK